MNFEVSKEAAEWYKSEMDLEQGDYVQYYIQLYGGIPTAHPNYSLGMSVGKEGSIGEKAEVEGITFYFNEENSWFLKEFDMKVIVENEEFGFVFLEK
ncbi:HesB/YadR/YfhF family protein [Sporosarcina sp. NPDC096371]|uniref:HesB/YadR/YfhF family protein n=1 Tax=Sporosarcina sp. NPDC096371 TaxID=3364530 RepID=UPI00380AE680